MTPELFTQVTTIVTVIGTGLGTLAIQIYRESRNRRWDLEDRQTASAALKAEVVALAAKTAQDHQAVADALALEAARAQTARNTLAATLVASNAVAAEARERIAATLVENERRAGVERLRLATDVTTQRQRLAEDLTAAAASSAHDLAGIAQTLAAQNDASTKVREDLMMASATNAAAIEKVHVAASNAFQEANHVNQKIENLNLRLAEARNLAVHTSDAVAAVHQAADNAYHEANHVNAKIEDLNKRLVEAETTGPLPLIQRTVETTYQALIEGQAVLVQAFDHDRRNRKAGALSITAAINALAAAASRHEAEAAQDTKESLP